VSALRSVAAVLVSAVGLMTTAGHATQINTVADTEVLQKRYCPELATQLARAKLDYTCAATSGTADAVKRVNTEPREIGIGQLDVYANEASKFANPNVFKIIRSDDLRQCLFAVTLRKDLTNFGELSAHAPKLRFVLPPPETGSSDAFRILQQIDTAGLGQTSRVEHTTNAAEAVRHALSAEDTVAFFVQFPDPEDPAFKLVREMGGHFIPLIDREVLRRQINGEKVYFAQETQVANADWLASGKQVVTTCTPTVVFTGSPLMLTDGKARQDHEDLIATIRALKTEALLPPETTFSRVLKRTKELSASSAEQLMKASEQARENAGPYLESAKEAADKAIEAAKPALERAKEYGINAYERAREGLKDLMAPKKDDAPVDPPKQ
jgi:hypothetical protein